MAGHDSRTDLFDDSVYADRGRPAGRDDAAKSDSGDHVLRVARGDGGFGLHGEAARLFTAAAADHGVDRIVGRGRLFRQLFQGST